jgi:regulator of replication initiation timing
VKKMDEKRLDRMENMLIQLVGMVGNMNEQLQGVKDEQQSMKQDMQEVKKEQTTIRGEVTDIKNKLTEMHADQNHIWEKAARNERELAILRSRLQL